MRQNFSYLTVNTSKRGLLEITGLVQAAIDDFAISRGLATLFCRHTSASLLIQENADPDVRADLETFFVRLVKDDISLYRHTDEGADDMPAHIRSALTQTQLSIPIEGGKMVLGTWQGIYLFEHRQRAHERTLALHLLGE